MTRTTLEEAQTIVLVAIYETIYDVAEDDVFGVDQIRAMSRAPFSTAFIRRVLNALREADQVQYVSNEYDEEVGYTLTSKGLLLAEQQPELVELLEISEIDPITVPAVEIPASDRIVSLDHNDPSLNAITEAAEDLANDLRQSNDVGDLSAENVTVALREVEQIQDDISRSRIRLNSFLAKAKSTLEWIGEKAAETVISAAALGLLALILAYFGIGA